MSKDPIKAIITGATGMAGEGVLHICLNHPNVEQILVINRKPCGVQHPKLKEIIHTDFYDLSPIEDQLIGYNACFFCLGISSVGMKETGRIMWARVKGKTENDLMKLPFRDVFAFRPGFIKPIKGLKHVHSFYKYINWLFPIGRKLYPGGFCSMQELALSMIYVVQNGYPKKALEGNDIISLAKR